MIKQCQKCESEFQTTDSNAKYCGHSCAASITNLNRVSGNSIKKNCLNCNKKLNRTIKIFCTQKCQMDYYYTTYISEWKLGNESGLIAKECVSNHIKKYIWKKYNSKCSICGWCTPHPADGKPPLEIEHIDGDFRNNKEENLTLLCPNCHSLTTTYKGRNKGMGRPSRKAKMPS